MPSAGFDNHAEDIPAQLLRSLFQHCDFIHTFGDAHIYNNHIEQLELQLSRDIRPLPIMKLNPDIKNIFDFNFEDFTLEGYDPHPHIKGAVAI